MSELQSRSRLRALVCSALLGLSSGIAILVLGGLALGALGTQARAEAPTPRTSEDTRKKTALLIGIGQYEGVAKLSNPLNDVNAIAPRLREIAFEVTLVRDGGLAEIERGIAEFVANSRDADVALVYYAGHGVQIDGENYMIPVDFKLNKSAPLKGLVGVNKLLLALDKVAKAKVILLDACRDNPFLPVIKAALPSRAIGPGLAPINITPVSGPPSTQAYGLIIGYATQANNVALDGKAGNSPFASALLEAIRLPDEDLNTILVRAAATVVRETKGAQRPEHKVALTRPLFLLSRSRALACDELAAARDNNAFVPGVDLDQIDAQRAIPACRIDLDSNPDHPRLMHNLARSLERGGRLDEAIGLYRQAAELGYAASQNDLGVMLLLGRGVEQDVPQSLNWLRKAYDQGNRNALSNYALTDRVALFRKSKRRTRELQAALMREGLLGGPPSGQFDDQTERAVEAFKKKRGIERPGFTFEVIHLLGLADKLSVKKGSR